MKTEKSRNLSSKVGFLSESQRLIQNQNFPENGSQNIHLKTCPKNPGYASNLTPRIRILLKCQCKIWDPAHNWIPKG